MKKIILAIILFGLVSCEPSTDTVIDGRLVSTSDSLTEFEMEGNYMSGLQQFLIKNNIRIDDVVSVYFHHNSRYVVVKNRGKQK